MTLLNFPPTNGQPTDGSFTYTANGVVYTWDGEKWTANTAGSGGMGTVHFTGDSPPPAGEATETDQWFNTNDGRLYTYTKNVNGVLVWADASPDSQGDQLWDRNGTTLEPTNDGDDVDLGTGDLSAADGTFSGLLTANTTGDYSTNPGLAIETSGLHRAYRATSDANAGIQVWHSNVGSTYRPRITFWGNGSISLGGTSSNDTYNGRWNSNGTIEIGSDVPANGANITLNADGQGVFYVASTASATSVARFLSNANGVRTGAVEVRANGAIFATNTTLQSITSERRLKENINPVDAATAWETIKSVPYYSYNFIGGDPSNVVYGPIADEVPDEMRIETDRTDDVGVIHTYDNGMLQARLYTALQTALTRIEALEAKVQQLEGGN